LYSASSCFTASATENMLLGIQVPTQPSSF
jgi:hypothetical protein